MKYLKIIDETISDGMGLRMSVYLSGCTHHCSNCHNRDSWDPNNGTTVTNEIIDEIIEKYQSNPLLDGITFTGGDPLYNFEEFYSLVSTIKNRLNCNIWVYTGYTYSEIKNEPFTKYIDVLVDGKFVPDLFDPTLQFRGSSNQNIIVL